MLSFFLVIPCYAELERTFFAHLIRDSEFVIVGKFEETPEGKIIISVDRLLKGELDVDKPINVTENSAYALEMMDGGGYFPHASFEEFAEKIKQRSWFGQEAIILGNMNEGVWQSSYVDFAVWTSGDSPNEEQLKGLSLEELAEKVREQVIGEEERQQAVVERDVKRWLTGGDYERLTKWFAKWIEEDLQFDGGRTTSERFFEEMIRQITLEMPKQEARIAPYRNVRLPDIPIDPEVYQEFLKQFVVFASRLSKVKEKPTGSLEEQLASLKQQIEAAQAEQ